MHHRPLKGPCDKIKEVRGHPPSPREEYPMSRTPFLSNAGVTTKPMPDEETRTRHVPPYNVIQESVNLQLTPVVNNLVPGFANPSA
jgi:hypothetical protein